ADKWLDDFGIFRDFPQSYEVSLDHMKPKKTPLADMSDEDLEAGLVRLKNVKKGEFLVGKVYRPDDEAFESDEAFIKDLETVMEMLFRLYCCFLNRIGTLLCRFFYGKITRHNKWRV